MTWLQWLEGMPWWVTAVPWVILALLIAFCWDGWSWWHFHGEDPG